MKNQRGKIVGVAHLEVTHIKDCITVSKHIHTKTYCINNEEFFSNVL